MCPLLGGSAPIPPAGFIYYTRQMIPIPRRARSFLVVVFIHANRKEAEEGETEKQQQFT